VAEGRAGTQVTIVANDIGPVGGMERQLTELITGLLERGHEVTVVSWTCALPAHPGLRWIRVPGPSRPFAIAYPLFVLLASLLVWRRGRGPLHSTGAIVLNRTDVCTVHFCHRAIAELPGLSRASRSGLPYRLNARVTRTMSRLAERWCYRRGRARRLIGVSEGVARELRRHFPQMRDRIAVVPNGVDTEEFRPPRPPRPSAGSELEVLFVGSEWERKGLRFAIEALRDCPFASLTVVGEGDAAAYRELAEGMSLGDRVEFAGSSSDVASWYRRADVFLLPTLYETFSLVSYEAAASGLPLLVTPVNGVEDVLRDGVNGWFVERDASRIAARLRALHADPELRAEMGRQARADSLRFSWSQVVESYEEIYREAAVGAAA
jgi:UDP-glucose:(heptosyl)LPS alpha-1,3-glucosyltransferase